MNIRDIIEQEIGFSDAMIAITNEIKLAKKIAIVGHVDPDMDCIGSQKALNEALQQLSIDSYAVNTGPFDFNAEDMKAYFSDNFQDDTDLIIALDTANMERIAAPTINADSKLVVIDHHITNTNYGYLNYIDDNFISTAEMVFIMLVYMEFDFTKSIIPQLLLNGILADNGYYRHIRTNKFLSLLNSYLLISMGADPHLTYKEMFINNNSNNVRLLGLLLNRIEGFNDDTIITTHITEKDIEEYHGKVTSLFIFKEMMSIKSGKIFILFKPIDSENKVIVSFRSEEGYDVSLIAQKFGGGGHKVASGASIVGTYEEVKAKVLEATKNYCKKRDNEKIIP